VGAGAAAYFFYVGRERGERLEAQVGQLEQELETANSRAQSLEREAAAASGELAALQADLSQTSTQLEAMEAKVAKKAAVASELEAKLNDLLEEGQGEVLVGKDGRLTLQLVDKVLFRSGEADLTPRGEKVMARVGQALEEMKDKQIWVQGHTDRKPIKKNSEFFASNWELSSARALTVVHYLQDVSKVDPRRLAATAFSSYRPVSKRKLAKNRRIEIVLMPLDIRVQRD
jgi:chemotaxis protein MotB